MAKDINILGAAVVTQSGQCLAGDLGIKQDIDIAMAMFTAVESYVEDTIGEAPDQVRLPSMDITRVKGVYTFLIVLSTATSEELIGFAKSFLEQIETNHPELDDWDGQVIIGLETEFDDLLKELRLKAGREQDIKLPRPGFDIIRDLKDTEWKHEPERYARDLEDAYDIYFIAGEHDTALKLAQEAAKLFEARTDDRHSSLFDALAAKVLVQKGADKETTVKLLKRAREKSEAQNNTVARAEAANAIALCYTYEMNAEAALAWSRTAQARMRQLRDLGPRDFIRLTGFRIVEVYSLTLAGRNDEAIEEWKSILEELRNLPPGASGIDGLMLKKQEIILNNNIGFFTIMRDRLKRENYEEAVPYFRAGLKKIEESGARTIWYSLFLRGNLAWALAFTGGLDEAKALLEGVLKDAQELNDPTRIAAAKRLWGIYYYRKGQDSKEKKDRKKHFYRALSLFDEALETQHDKSEIEGIEFFRNETERALRDVL